MGRRVGGSQLRGLPYCINIQMNQPSTAQGTTTSASAPIAAHP
jgi:hypothetical protein